MLTIKDLHIQVEDKPIVKGVDLKLKQGEVHAAMGPNGSGKSTLAYALAGHPHYEVTQGKVKLKGEDVLDMSPDQRAQAGIFLAFQYPVTVEGVSVQNFLKTAVDHVHPGTIKKVIDFRNKLQEYAEFVGLDPDLLSRSLNDGFSGGEKKRIELIQMLALKPKLAIFDETDSGLDIDSIKLAAKAIKKTVKDNDTTCLVITHYQRILDYLDPDRVHVMVDGQVVKSGNASLVEELEKEGYGKWSEISG